MEWNFKREENEFEIIPEGQHRIRINSVEKATSKNSGNEMLSFKFDVSGQSGQLFHHIVFLEDRPQITNRMLTQFFDSFQGIHEGDFNLNNWVGKVGACVVKHEEYNGKTNAKISYFLSAEKQASLPPWKEGGSGNAMPMASLPNVATADGFVTMPQGGDSVPFTF